MRILLLCDRFPFPLTNGQNLRIDQFVRHLNTAHRFDLVCYGDSEPPARLYELFPSIRYFQRPKDVRDRGLRRLVSSWSPGAMLTVSEAVRDHVAQVTASGVYDAIWVSGWDMIQNLPPNPNAPVLADVVDDGVLEFWREFRTAESLGTSLRKLKWVIVNALFERKYFCSQANRMVVSETDASVLKRVCMGLPVSVVHNGVDENFFSPTEGKIEPRTLVFEGNIAFGPNADGVRYFIKDILPRIRDVIPDIKMLIVGKDPPADIQEMGNGESIIVTGYVDDVRPYVHSAAVFVCPLRKGAGIKNKLLQAWSMGKPVVATSKCIGGLRVEADRNILVRDDPREFARAVVRLVQNPEFAQSVGARARATICESYSWARTAQQLERVLSDTARVGSSRN